MKQYRPLLFIVITLLIGWTLLIQDASAQQLKQIQKGTAQNQIPVTNGYQNTQVYRNAIPYILDSLGIRDSLADDQTLTLLDSINRVFRLQISNGNTVKWKAGILVETDGSTVNELADFYENNPPPPSSWKKGDLWYAPSIGTLYISTGGVPSLVWKQADWNETNTDLQPFIKNKPDIGGMIHDSLGTIVSAPDSTFIKKLWGITLDSVGNTYSIGADSAQVTSIYQNSLKQNLLISGTNIKTVNGNTLLGSGNVAVGTFTLPSLTNGSVLFSDGTTIAQDNANFFWDDTNNEFELTGNFIQKFPNSLYTNTNIGTNMPLTLTGSYNFATGFENLKSATTAGSNFGSGFRNLYSLTTGNYNFAAGTRNLYTTTTQSYNFGSGYENLYSNSGSSNFANGNQNMYSNTGSYNFAAGEGNLNTNTGSYNFASGGYNLYNTTGSYNFATGVTNMFAASSGSYNFANGGNNLRLCTSCSYNFGNGFENLKNITTGQANFASGLQNLTAITTGSYNIALPYQAGYQTTTGENNIFLGYYSGYSNVTGSKNVFLGFNSGFSETGSSKLYITNTAGTTTGIFGDFVAGTYGVNQAPSAMTRTWDVNGEFRVRDLVTTTPTKIMAADNDGVVSSLGLSGLSISGGNLVNSFDGDITGVTVSAPITGGGTSGSVNIALDTTSTTGAFTNYKGTLKQNKLTGATGQTLYFSATNTPTATYQVFINGSGQVGINNPSPAYHLDVSGSMHASAGFYDSSGDFGNAGQVLTGQGYAATNWETPPTASSSVTGYLSSTDWTTFNNKVGGSGTINKLAYWNGTTTIAANGNFHLDNTNSTLSIGVGSAGTYPLDIQSNGSSQALRAMNAATTKGFTVTPTTTANAQSVGVYGNVLIDGQIHSSTQTPAYGTSGQVLTSQGTGDWIWTTPSSGTVSSFSSGNLSPLFTTSVATSTTTPALSFSLSSVANANYIYASPNGSSGTPSFRAIVPADIPTLNQNTTGTAGSAGALITPRTIGIVTGDATSSGSSFNGTANNTNALTLATVNSNVGSFTNATVTVNAKGLITAASSGSAGMTSWLLAATGTAGTASITNGATVTHSVGAGLSVSRTGNTILHTNTGDTNAADDLTIASVFAGDVSGAYNNLQLGTGVVGATEISSSGVTAGSYTLTSATIDVDGRVTSASNGTACTISTFTSTGTYTKPAGAKSVYVRVIGAGGGGGGGSKFATSTFTPGGGGGNGGGISEYTFHADDVPSSVSVVVGTGGGGGAGATSNDAEGTTGTTGGVSNFGTLLYAEGGLGGKSFDAQKASLGVIEDGGVGAYYSGAGAAFTAANTKVSPTGGGAGGYISAANATNNTNVTAGTLILTSNSGTPNTGIRSGIGGVGGNASTSGNGSAGTAAAATGYGAGGGGGGAARNSVGNGGSGASGRQGAVIVITYF